MPQLLIELFSEEIPARMQAQAARDLDRMVRERLAEQGLLPEGLKTFAGPRRLTLARYCPPQAGFSACPESAGDCSPGCGDAECGGHCHHHLFCCGHFSCTPAVTPQDGPTLHFLHEHSDMRPVSPSTGHLPELIRPPRTA